MVAANREERDMNVQWHLASFILIVAVSPFLDGAEDSTTSATLSDYMKKIDSDQNNVDAAYTWAETAFWISAMLCAILLGRLSDCFSMKLLYITSYAVTLIGNSLYICAQNNGLWFLVIARFFDGISYGNQTLTYIYISRITLNTTQFAQYTAVQGFCYYLGQIIGPLLSFDWTFHFLGYTFNTYTYAVFFLALVIVCVILLFIFVLEEPPAHTQNDNDTNRDVENRHRTQTNISFCEMFLPMWHIIPFCGLIVRFVASYCTGLVKFSIRPFSSDLLGISMQETALYISIITFACLLITFLIYTGLLNIKVWLLASGLSISIGSAFLVALMIVPSKVYFFLTSLFLYICIQFIVYHVMGVYNDYCKDASQPGVLIAMLTAVECSSKVVGSLVYYWLYEHTKLTIGIIWGISYILCLIALLAACLITSPIGDVKEPSVNEKRITEMTEPSTIIFRTQDFSKDL